MRGELRAGFMLIMQIGVSPGRVGPSGGTWSAIKRSRRRSGSSPTSSARTTSKISIIGANEIPIPPLDGATSTLQRSSPTHTDCSGP
jgi:hypothetical protein